MKRYAIDVRCLRELPDGHWREATHEESNDRGSEWARWADVEAAQKQGTANALAEIDREVAKVEADVATFRTAILAERDALKAEVERLTFAWRTLTSKLETERDALAADNARLRAALEHLVAASEFNSLLETRKEALAIAREALEKKP